MADDKTRLNICGLWEGDERSKAQHGADVWLSGRWGKFGPQYLVRDLGKTMTLEIAGKSSSDESPVSIELTRLFEKKLPSGVVFWTGCIGGPYGTDVAIWPNDRATGNAPTHRLVFTPAYKKPEAATEKAPSAAAVKTSIAESIHKAAQTEFDGFTDSDVPF